jgi:hypothetical protein
MIKGSYVMIVHFLILPDIVVLFHFLPHRLVDKRWRKPKGQSRMDNQEKLSLIDAYF